MERITSQTVQELNFGGIEAAVKYLNNNNIEFQNMHEVNEIRIFGFNLAGKFARRATINTTTKEVIWN